MDDKGFRFGVKIGIYSLDVADHGSSSGCKFEFVLFCLFVFCFSFRRKFEFVFLI